MIKRLKEMVKCVTLKNDSWLQDEFFKLRDVEYSIDNDYCRIDLTRFGGDQFKISVFDIELQKTVFISFDFPNDNSVRIFVIFSKKRNISNFCRKQHFSYEMSEENQNNDENVKFVWDRVSKYLINLKF